MTRHWSGAPPAEEFGRPSRGGPPRNPRSWAGLLLYSRSMLDQPQLPVAQRTNPERSFKEEVRSLRLGDGELFRGEGILAVTKAILQSGVSYVGGYQGAPV